MPNILNLRRDDSPDSILLHIQQTGPDLLDLRMIGTDGQSPFTANLKHRDISQCRSRQFRGTDDEWAGILKALFTHDFNLPDGEFLKGVEAVASVADDAITISIRRNISGITQRLGSLTLALDEQEPIELFDWAGIAANTAADQQSQFLAAQQSIVDQKETILRLTAQLDQLVDAKKQHDEQLMSKFAALLNSKKLKIRDQQRLLSHAKLDPRSAKHVQQSRSESSKSRTPNASRHAKRKANNSLEDTEMDDDDEPTQVDDDEDGQSDGHLTPSKSDATDDETDDDAFDAPAPVSTKSQTPNQQKPPAVSQQQQVPPRRELPFVNTNDKTSQRSMPVQPNAAIEDDETEDETDDEL